MKSMNDYAEEIIELLKENFTSSFLDGNLSKNRENISLKKKAYMSALNDSESIQVAHAYLEKRYGEINHTNCRSGIFEMILELDGKLYECVEDKEKYYPAFVSEAVNKLRDLDRECNAFEGVQDSANELLGLWKNYRGKADLVLSSFIKEFSSKEYDAIQTGLITVSIGNEVQKVDGTKLFLSDIYKIVSGLYELKIQAKHEQNAPEKVSSDKKLSNYIK